MKVKVAKKKKKGSRSNVGITITMLKFYVNYADFKIHASTGILIGLHRTKESYKHMPDITRCCYHTCFAAQLCPLSLDL